MSYNYNPLNDPSLQWQSAGVEWTDGRKCPKCKTTVLRVELFSLMTQEGDFVTSAAKTSCPNPACKWTETATDDQPGELPADAWHAPDIGMRRDVDGELYEVELPPDDQPATIDDLLQFSEPHLAAIAAALSAALAQAEIDLKIAAAVAADSRADLLPIASQVAYELDAQRIRERRDELAEALGWVNELKAATTRPG